MKKVLVIGETLSNNHFFEFIGEILEKIPDWHISTLSVPSADSPTERETVLLRQGCTVKYFYSRTLRQRSGKLYRVFRGLKRMLAHFSVKEYDVLVVHGVSAFSFLSAFTAQKDARLVVIFWGSDLLRAKKSVLLLMRPLLRRANAVVFMTRYMADYFSEVFNGCYDDRAVVVTLGAKNVDALYTFSQSHTKEECKAAYHLPVDKLCIFCGYNGERSHRHKEIFHLLETLPQKYKDAICLVFHCAYGLDDDYKAELESLLGKSDMDCRLLTDFLAGDDLAALRMCADVMLNLQPTDGLSSSTLESMEAGAIFIKGDWLFYPEIVARGAYLLSIPSMAALPELIQSIVENPERYREKTKDNRGISLLRSWDTVRDDWIKVLGAE